MKSRIYLSTLFLGVVIVNFGGCEKKPESCNACDDSLGVLTDAPVSSTPTDDHPCMVPEEISLPHSVSELANVDAKAAVVIEQALAIEHHKEVVDKVDEDIQIIQQSMKQRRSADLESLAKSRRWGHQTAFRRQGVV